MHASSLFLSASRLRRRRSRSLFWCSLGLRRLFCVSERSAAGVSNSWACVRRRFNRVCHDRRLCQLSQIALDSGVSLLAAQGLRYFVKSYRRFGFVFSAAAIAKVSKPSSVCPPLASTSALTAASPRSAICSMLLHTMSFNYENLCKLQNYVLL